MTCCTALETDTMWLRQQNYHIVALSPRLSPRVPEVAEALKQGLRAYPDANRENFFDVELESGWAYIHVRDEARTVYLVAYSRT